MSAFKETPAPNSVDPQLSASSISAKRLWTGRVLSGLAGAFLLFDGGAKLLKAAPVIEAMTRLGYPQSTIVIIGTILLASTLLYVIPRTAILGAVLLSAYLGGAVATNLRVSGPVFPIVFPILFGSVVWGGLCLRDARLRTMFS